MNVTGTALGIYFGVVRPWHLKWGATGDEARRRLPGDEHVSETQLVSTRAITIHAPASKVWPWIVQLGQGRGGLYSYERLENLLGFDIHNADRIVPEFQTLQIGDRVSLWPSAAITVKALEPERALVLAGSFVPTGGEGDSGSWTFVLVEDVPDRTRLLVRTRVAAFQPRWLSGLFYRFVLEPSHFVMERKMLLGIKQRAEHMSQDGTALQA